MKRLDGLRVRHLALFAGLMLAPFMGPAVSPAAAQASGCEQIKTFLDQRKALVERLNKLGKKPDAKSACSLLTNLASNGSTTLKWVDSNKDWCQIPDEFVNGFKADNSRVTKFRGQACNAAAQQATMQKRAQQQQQQQSNSPFNVAPGGDVLTGPMRIPQGAL
ncbi:conserved exported hypothetical protein [Hyphomicrobiales bacterium]|nr:conserved exported hypothetical protein [Hyphomicrobiales bacterium]CAH1671552.1 conserved exported hypothetical protein [Hyphomicrobiales bacterium]